MSLETSPIRLAKGQRLIGVNVVAQTPAQGSPAQGATLSTAELKEIQRRAFDRGRAVESAEWTNRFAKTLAALVSAAKRLDDAREVERKDAESFAARLASLAADKLLHRVTGEGSHDVAAMVLEILEEIGATADSKGVAIRLNPDDHAMLTQAFRAQPPPVAAGGVELIADPALGRACFDVAAAGTEFYSSLSERLEALRAGLLEEVRHRD